MVNRIKSWLAIRDFKKQFNNFIFVGYHMNSKKLSILTTQLEKDINNIVNSNFNSMGKIIRVLKYLENRMGLTNDNEVYDMLFSLVMLITLIECKWGLFEFED